MGYYLGYYLGYYMGYYMGYGGPVGVSGWGGPAGTPVCCRRCVMRLEDASTLPVTTRATAAEGRQGSLKEVASETPVASQARRARPLHPADDDVGFRRSWATTWVRSSSDHCVNVNRAPRIRTPSRRSGARSCHAPGGMAA